MDRQPPSITLEELKRLSSDERRSLLEPFLTATISGWHHPSKVEAPVNALLTMPAHELHRLLRNTWDLKGRVHDILEIHRITQDTVNYNRTVKPRVVQGRVPTGVWDKPDAPKPEDRTGRGAASGFPGGSSQSGGGSGASEFPGGSSQSGGGGAGPSSQQ